MRITFSSLAIGFWLLTAGPLRAQEETITREPTDLDRARMAAERELGPPTRVARPRLPLRRTEVAPVIDGLLSEEVWGEAAVLDGLTQVEPDEGARPTEHTELRFLYDRDFIYIGIRCFDSDPGGIIATQMVRDADLSPDDRVELVFDTFFDRRNAFFFQINPVGARGDALIENSGNFNKEWDGIWYGRASIDDAGWVAEIALPFKTLSFDPASDSWGFNVVRVVRRRNEVQRWATPTRNSGLFEIGDAGVLEAIREIDQGLGLDVKPFVSGTYSRDHLADGDDLSLDAGFDLFYKITPQLTAAVTVNTDFAETEVDERRVNLTRFPLFFPEKRDFFLQDAGIFTFGGIRRDPLPFFSRRIGIGPDGRPLDILGGVKVTGRVGDVNLGVLDVQVAEGDDLDSKNLAVGRVTVNVLDESSIGIIATNGDPRTNDDNTLVGGDFNFRKSDFLGDKILAGNAWIQRSFTTGVDEDQTAFGGRISFPNDEIDAEIGASQIDANFNPALGFTRRLGIREYFASARYRFRPESALIRTVDVGANAFLVTDLDDVLESGDLRFDLIEVETHDGDSLRASVGLNAERLFEDFEIMDGVVVPRGRYDFVRYGAELETSDGRPVSGRVEVEAGDFFDGTRFDLELGIDWRPSSHFLLGVEYEQNDIRLADGDFVTRIIRGRFNVFFTPDISWNTFVQYDNVSDVLGINSRFRWIIEPGRELFFVVNQGILVRDDTFRAASSEVTIKLGWTFRF